MLRRDDAENNMGMSGSNGMNSTSGSKLDNAKEKVRDHLKNKVAVVDDIDKQVWELVSNMPAINKPLAVIITLFNLILPGIGTILASCFSSDNTVSKT